MLGHHVAIDHKSDYAVTFDGKNLVQIIDNGPDCSHWLIVREGHVEQKVALTFSTLLLLCKAVSLLPSYKRLQEEKKP